MGVQNVATLLRNCVRRLRRRSALTLTSPSEDRSGTAFSCVVDNDAFLIAQCFLWVNCLLKLHAVPPGNIFVHAPGLDAPEFLGWLRSAAVNVLPIEPFDRRSPHCNKLRQLESFAANPFERIVLMDCDMAWIGEQPLPGGSPVAAAMAKVVDYANPPESVLAAIFREAGLGAPDWVEVTFSQGEDRQRTDRNNCNGGLYILSGAIIARLAPLWTKWAIWCLDRRALFGDCVYHADQIGFALAAREMGLTVSPLPIEWNYPTHLLDAPLPDIAPQILHYHRQLTPHLLLQTTGVPGPDKAIAAMNAFIGGVQRSDLLNSIFWDLRYHLDPALGSGVGSRGDSLAVKRKWLAYALAPFAEKEVLDIGCGDLEVTRELPLAHYTGTDLSEQALRIAQAKRPDWRFIRFGPGMPEQADAVICLDVLIHQPSTQDFDQLIERLVKTARQRLIVSGYDGPPQFVSDIVSYHRPITEALRTTGRFAEIAVIGRYRDTSLVVADRPRPGVSPHPKDIAPEDFNLAATLTDRPDLLRHLVDLSRAETGFYPQGFGPALAYPWVAAKLEALPPGQRCLALGGGPDPLRLFLTRRGDTVACPEPANLKAQDAVQVVYAIGVLGQTPRRDWSLLLHRCREWLSAQGRLILTADLIAETDLLCGGDAGQAAEDPSDAKGLLRLLQELGFAVLDQAIQRQIPRQQTGQLLIDCLRT